MIQDTRRFDLPTLSKPGLFITGTDTDVGKTVITSAIARSLVRRGMKVGVCKPFATGCRKDREGLVSEDAEMLAFFADFDSNIGGLPLISPCDGASRLRPAVAAETARESLNPESIAIALQNMDRECDILLIEGIGGVMVPLDPADPHLTVLDFARELGFPAVVVCRAALGTLNHTALTCTALRNHGVRVAGLIVNEYLPDNSDTAMQTNRTWLERMNRVPILATVPRTKGPPVLLKAGWMDEDLLGAVAMTAWEGVARKQGKSARSGGSP